MEENESVDSWKEKMDLFFKLDGALESVSGLEVITEFHRRTSERKPTVWIEWIDGKRQFECIDGLLELDEGWMT